MFKNLEWCCNNEIKPLYNDIKYKDYFAPLIKYSKENNNIYSNIINKKKINSTVMHYYIKSSTNISVIILYPTALKYPELIKKMISDLQSNGDIHYIKDIKLSYLTSFNLIFQLYANEKRMKKTSDILYKINRLGFFNDNNKYTIKVIIYTIKNNNKKINGKSATYKMELRNIFLKEDIKITNYNESDDNYPRGYDYLHISDNNNQAYEYAGLLLNKESIKFIKKQQAWKITELYHIKQLLNCVKKFFYNYSQLELEKLLIYDSAILFSYGIREPYKLDCILLENNILNSTDINKLNNNKLDIYYKDIQSFNNQKTKQLNKMTKLCGASNYNELVYNPKYYYYFMGLKFLKLKYDIKIRLHKNGPEQITDLLIIRQLYNLKYKIEIIKNKNKFLDSIKYYLQSRYYINLNITQINDWINLNFPLNNSKQKNKYTNNNNSELTIINKNYDNLINYINESDDKYIYPTIDEIINMGYIPLNIIIYSSNKPYLYPGELFNLSAVKKACDKLNSIRKEYIKNNNKLRIVTFNVHNFISRCNQGIAPIFNTNLNPFNKARDINKFIDLFKLINADVLCLQEIVPIIEENIENDITDFTYIRENFNFSYLNSLMKKIGYNYSIIGSTQKGKFYKSDNKNYYYLANAIYSKIKINSYEILGFSYLNRNIIKCTINFNNKNIDIINTHFEYSNNYNPIIKSNNQTIQQFIDFNNYINNIHNNNIIICGDFNINLYNNITNQHFKEWDKKTNFLRNNFINNCTATTFTNFSQNDITDFIIHKNNSNLKSDNTQTITTDISDHYLIFSDFI